MATTPDYERDLATLGDAAKQKTLAGYGYKYEYADKAKGIGGWIPQTDAAKAKYKQIYGEDFAGLLDKTGKLKMATLAHPTGKKVASFVGKAYTSGLFGQGFQLWTGDNNAVINQNQQTDFQTKEQEAAPPTTDMPTTGTIEDAMKPYTGILDKLTADKPEVPSMEDAFRDEMAKNGIPELEQSVNDLTKQKQDIEAEQRQRKQTEEGKPVAMGVIAGRTSEIDRQEYEKLDYVGRQIDYATNQLNTKYAMVNTIMGLKQTDYANAKADYDSSFSQAMQMIDFVKGVTKDWKDEKWRTYTEEQRVKERTEDNARANLTVIYNSITSGNTDYGSLDATTKSNITKMELESGFPVGFVQKLHNNNPKQDIVSTTSRQEPNGDSYADIIMRDKTTGAVSVQHIFLGKEKMAKTSSSSSSTSAGNIGNVTKDQAGGLSFTDKKGEPITAGQYAASNNENLVSVLGESGNPDDQANIDFINMAIEDITAGKKTIEEVYAEFQKGLGHIFNGITLTQFKQILGVKQGTKKR